jgi:hypothetical protein
MSVHTKALLDQTEETVPASRGQHVRLVGGMLAFLGGYYLVFLPVKMITGEVSALVWVLFGVLQTCGGMVMCSAALDIEVFAENNQYAVIVCALLMLAVIVVSSLFDTPWFYLDTPPIMYLILRFRPVIQREAGFPTAAPLLCYYLCWI